MINNPPSSSASGAITTFSKATNSQSKLAANTALEILKENPKRLYAAFVNNGFNDITLVLGEASKAALNKGIVIRPYGGSYEIAFINLYTGKVSAICASVADISFVEGFE